MVGQTLALGSSRRKGTSKRKGKDGGPLQVIDPPVRKASGPEVMTYNDLAPPSAVDRVSESEQIPRAPPAPSARRRARPWLILIGAISMGLGCGLVLGLFVLGVAMLASQLL
jgi:hypothetical protein